MSQYSSGKNSGKKPSPRILSIEHWHAGCWVLASMGSKCHLLAILLVVHIAFVGELAAQAPGDVLPVAELSAEKSSEEVPISLMAGFGVFASYPGSYEDPGPAFALHYPLWTGERGRFFQWKATGTALLGLGTDSWSAHLAFSPQIGLNVFLGSVLGLEFRMGLAGITQLGRDSVVGLGFAGGGGYVFRFWEDDRKRIKLEMNMYAGGFFAKDPGNDLGTNAAGFTGGLAYEFAF